ncbi:uncharacterized protein LOC143620074 [Bidens hawaiensis]|uniref:uncharacterized protein LOC143620074 n=1 Tax=Bidens hawaiensis TaxID=980011 RepID=UPI00404AA8A2
MGFPMRWRGWIRGIISSAKSSVVVNGSPTFEFKCERGIRQGKPISPFLFIIGMEALSVLFLNACDQGLFEGMQLPNRGPYISNLLFTDDALILDVFNARLTSWKARSLSMGGRFTLLKSVLESIPTYYFSLYKAPTKVIDELESKRRNFLWGSTDNRRKIHWVAWEWVTRPKKDGGQGLCPLISPFYLSGGGGIKWKTTRCGGR